ncbi:hypothetical protein DY000_02006467 [Brassica cretica]|uniref:Arabidopsis retrotransposon Orf1 C-terminal domain-containing protein n=1 Tax=Brassica cretica TaxID=69181 RepID=A0ABQ7C4M3_BRACR|nr:hypothetical protein DY000_02006467 [Brassica cretica]
MVDSQRKNNSLMRRILHLVTGGCIGGSNQRQSPADQAPRSHRPGKAPMGTGPSTEEVHHSRNRRLFDPAESGDPFAPIIAVRGSAITIQSRFRCLHAPSNRPIEQRKQTTPRHREHNNQSPREQEDEPINLDYPMLLDFNCEGWDKETASRYNALLKVEILPTRFCHAETLVELSIDEDVFETLQEMGIAPLCYATHEIYPDLVRQVLATATISYEDCSAPSYANCSFSFMADGEYCSLSLNKLNEIYEIANEPRGVAVAKKFAPSNTLWELIATGNFTPGKAYQSQIRKPALRVIAKIISNLLFAKDQTSKVTNGELQTLYAGIEDEIRASSTNKKDRSGSLLTPLFKHFGIDLSKYKVNTEIQYLDIRYLMACHIMRDEDTYSFSDKEGLEPVKEQRREFHDVRCHFGIFDAEQPHQYQTQGLQPPEHLSSDLLHYADDPPGHAGLLYHHVQESKFQPCLAAQYRSMFGLKYRSLSDGRCWSAEDECFRSMVVIECRSRRLVSGSTMADENRATNKCCC